MPYLRKPLQGKIDVELLANQSVSVDAASQLDSPNDSEFWEVSLVTVRVPMVGAGSKSTQGGNDNDTFIGAFLIANPPTADLKMAVQDGEFVLLTQDINAYIDGAFLAIANLSSPIVVSPSQQLSVQLTFSSFDSTILSNDAPGPLHLTGQFNILLSGSIKDGSE